MPAADDQLQARREAGRFVRADAGFRNWITPDGAAGPSGSDGFEALAGRYHLYVSYACPWANRTLIFRALKDLEPLITLSVVNWFMGEQGWTFEAGDGVIGDPVMNAGRLDELYRVADPDYTGPVTVPVLWDRHRGTIVSNESSEIIRMFNSAFDHLGAAEGDYYPEALRAEIDAVNERVYHTLNNGVYRAGFARTQEAYEEAVIPLFETLDWLEDRLASQRYLVGEQPTEADWRLFTTLVRFDTVYNGHFKCNIRRLVDYPNLWGYTRDLYQRDKIRDTVNFVHIKNHYYASHESINPNRIVPVGPVVEFDAPHDREQL